jgi:alpha-beta hydrolase superfamily lysophospholipase
MPVYDSLRCENRRHAAMNELQRQSTVSMGAWRGIRYVLDARLIVVTRAVTLPRNHVIHEADRTAWKLRVSKGMSHMKGQRQSYRELTHWKNYQPFLPAVLRLSDAVLPEEEWWHWQGAGIHLDRHPVEGAHTTVILLHGAGGYGRLLMPYAGLLRAAGFEVVAPDLPGYGLSRVPARLVSHDAWVACVSALVEAEHGRKQNRIVLFGCSLGGYLAYLVAAETRAVSGIIATTLADPRLKQVQAQFARHPLIAAWGLPLLPLFDRIGGRVRLLISWFSKMGAIANNPELVKVFLADPCGAGNAVSLHFMRSLFDAHPPVEPEAFDTCPVLLVHPGADRWTTVEASRLLFDRLNVRKRLVMLENCGHFPIEEPGVSQLNAAVIDFLQEQNGT